MKPPEPPKQVPLTQGFFALVDAEDYERVMQHKWNASIESRKTRVYAVRRTKKDELGHRPGKYTKVRMHRFILGLHPLPGPKDPVVDHINGDSLDNRKENLQKVTQEENMLRAEGWKRRRCEPNL